MTARDKLIEVIKDYDPLICFAPCANPCETQCPTPESLVDAHRDEVAIDMGRDLMENGLTWFVERLVGADNADLVWERHAGEA